MFPPQPQFSLPTPKYFNFHGSSCPFSLRQFAIGDSPSKVIYSTHSDISWTVPLPTLPLMYGSAPNISQNIMNSWVPKWLFSTTPPQCVFTIRLRCSRGPTPSFQWYSSAKQPPGHLNTGTFIFFNASSTSFRMPFVLGIDESSPTHTPS